MIETRQAGPARPSPGGDRNQASGSRATIGGGQQHEATGDPATVSGGRENQATGDYATVSGGENHEVSGDHATVPGGESNTASGDYSVAVGRAAIAAHDGAFVVGDSSSAAITSPGPDTAVFQTNLGVRGAVDAETLSVGDDTIQRTAGPAATGRVAADGDLDAGQQISDVIWDDENDQYVLDLSFEYDPETTATTVTPIATDASTIPPRAAVVDDDDLTVAFADGG